MGDTNLAMEIRTGTVMAVAFVVLGSCCVAASLESDSAAVTMIDVSAEHQVLSLTEKDAPQKGANGEGANWRVDALKKAGKIEASLKDVKKGTKNKKTTRENKAKRKDKKEEGKKEEDKKEEGKKEEDKKEEDKKEEDKKEEDKKEEGK